MEHRKTMRAAATTVIVFACSVADAEIIATVTPYSATPDLSNITFATSASNFTTPENSTATNGVGFAILGAPDHPPGNNAPQAPTIVDLGGTGVATWSIDLEFGTAFKDGLGIDLTVFGTQLNDTENFNLLASADGTTFSQIGFFDAPPGFSNSGTFFVEIDFNGMLTVADARFLRFTDVSGPTRSFDFDAVGITAPVPIPAAAWLFAPALAGLSFARRSSHRSTI